MSEQRGPERVGAAPRWRVCRIGARGPALRDGGGGGELGGGAGRTPRGAGSRAGKGLGEEGQVQPGCRSWNSSWGEGPGARHQQGGARVRPGHPLSLRHRAPLQPPPAWEVLGPQPGRGSPHDLARRQRPPRALTSPRGPRSSKHAPAPRARTRRGAATGPGAPFRSVQCRAVPLRSLRAHLAGPRLPVRPPSLPPRASALTYAAAATTRSGFPGREGSARVRTSRRPGTHPPAAPLDPVGAPEGPERTCALEPDPRLTHPPPRPPLAPEPPARPCAPATAPGQSFSPRCCSVWAWLCSGTRARWVDCGAADGPPAAEPRTRPGPARHGPSPRASRCLLHFRLLAPLLLLGS